MNRQKIKSFTQPFMNWINGPVMRAFARMGSQRHLIAMRNGIIATIPFVIVGATAFLLLNFPIGSGTGADSYLKSKFPADLNNMLLYIFRFSMGLMGLMAAWGIGSELGKSYKFSQTTSGLLAVFAYLMNFIPVNGGSMILGSLDGKSLFTAIFAAMVAVEIQHFCHRFKITIKMPASVPEAVSNSFSALFPVLFIGTIFGVLRTIVGFDFNTFLIDIFEPMKTFLTGGIGGAIVIVLFVTMFWWVGIHGTSMIGAVIRPIWQSSIDANTSWFANGRQGKVPFEVPEQFLQWFVWIGGAGATLGLIIAGLIFARSNQMKTITRVSAIPSLFNINEPIIFGLPIILNPWLLVPFIFAPITMTISAYFLQDWMNVQMVSQTAWTLPAPVGAYFSSGAQWKAIIIALIEIGIAVGIWTPFVISYDKKLRKEEAEQEAALKIKEEEKKAKLAAKEETIPSNLVVKGAN